MAYPSIVSHENGLPAFPRGIVLEGFFERARGLIGVRSMAPDEARVFPRCRSVHTWLMSMPIDVVCLDASRTVLSSETVPPWRLPRSVPGTRTVIETAAGSARLQGVTTGSRLSWNERERKAPHVQTLPS